MKKLVLIMFGMLMILSGCTSKVELESLTLAQYLEAVKNSEATLIYVHDEEKISNDYVKILNKAMKKKKTPIKAFNVKDLSDEEMLKFMEALPETKDSYVVPSLFFIKDKKLAGSLTGSQDEVNLNLFLEEQKID